LLAASSWRFCDLAFFFWLHFAERIGSYAGQRPQVSELHFAESHSEIDLLEIRGASKDPNEVRRSSHRWTTVLYNRVKAARRFVCIVVNICSDENFISSAMTSTKSKLGSVIYVRKSLGVYPL
jgi:hypothetical protein